MLPLIEALIHILESMMEGACHQKEEGILFCPFAFARRSVKNRLRFTWPVHKSGSRVEEENGAIFDVPMLHPSSRSRKHRALIR